MIKIDLNGVYPAKMKVIKKHGKRLGLDTSSLLKLDRYVVVWQDGEMISYTLELTFKNLKPKTLTIDEFLELKQSDIPELLATLNHTEDKKNDATEKAWRYLMKSKNGSYFVSSSYFVERDDVLYYCSGIKHGTGSVVASFEKYGEPIEVPYVEIKDE